MGLSWPGPMALPRLGPVHWYRQTTRRTAGGLLE
jgi:hypothetical protein